MRGEQRREERRKEKRKEEMRAEKRRRGEERREEKRRDERLTHWPPKSCMPSRAKTTMKRKRRKSKLIMDFMELSRDTTRFLREFQYLWKYR